MKKNIIILESAAGARLSNQLWNFISIYAYCLERGFSCKNYSFFELKRQPDGRYSRCDYNNFFDLPRGGWLNRLMIACQISQNKFCQKLRPCSRYVNFIKKYFSNRIIDSGIALKYNDVFYLPPSDVKSEHDKKELKKIESSSYKNIYTTGWLFRNPIGIIKHRQKILEFFKPKEHLIKKVNNFTNPLKSNYEEFIGIHIRQGDYKNFDGGKHFFEQNKIREIIDNFLLNFNKNKKKVLFIICSDGNIDEKVFNDLNIKISHNSAVESLFILASTNLIIGSNSTFGALAAYLGNISFIVFEKEIDWNYYRNKKEYFENKKCTTVCY